MSSRRRSISRLMAVVAVLLVAAPLVAGAAHGEDAVKLPDEFHGTASAAGLSFVSFKNPNPLPVGPGAFLTFESPEAEGELTADASSARTSLLYPGPAIAGLPALLCTAGATPFCGQAPPPVLVEAQYPQHPDMSLATDGISMRDPSAPATAGAGSGSAHVTAQSSTSTTRLAGYRVDAPGPAQQAVLDALTATLAGIPGAKRADDTSLFSFGGGTATQRIAPAGNGRVRTEAQAVVNDVNLLAGLVTIHAVKVTSFAVSDGRGVHDAGSTTDTSGVLVGGFPAHLGPDGIDLDGQGDHGQARQALNGVAAQVSDALHMAVTKLAMEVRDGAASRTADGTSAAADGLQISLGNDRVTDTSPPQVSALCTVTGQVQDPLSSGGLSLPPLCAVPDVTGTRDTYSFQLGRAGVVLTAEDYGDVGGDTGGIGSGDVLGGVTGGDLGGGGLTGSGDALAGGHAVSGAHRSGALPSTHSRSFLALEARWIGDASDHFDLFYLAFAATALCLLVLSKVVLRTTVEPREGSTR